MKLYTRDHVSISMRIIDDRIKTLKEIKNDMEEGHVKDAIQFGVYELSSIKNELSNYFKNIIGYK